VRRQGLEPRTRGLRGRNPLSTSVHCCALLQFAAAVNLGGRHGMSVNCDENCNRGARTRQGWGACPRPGRQASVALPGCAVMHKLTFEGTPVKGVVARNRFRCMREPGCGSIFGSALLADEAMHILHN
jgi:hypothetical protein